MFLRSIRKKNGKRYHYVLKSVRRSGDKQPTHQTVANLSGLPENVIDGVRGVLEGKRINWGAETTSIPLKVLSTRYFAPLWIALHFWWDLRIDQLAFLNPREFKNLTALVLARTVAPVACRSELRTEAWLRKSALHHMLGGTMNQWDRDAFYPLLTKLSQNWQDVEEHLWKQRIAVPRLYLYDITSTSHISNGRFRS